VRWPASYKQSLMSHPLPRGLDAPDCSHLNVPNIGPIVAVRDRHIMQIHNVAVSLALQTKHTTDLSVSGQSM